MRKAKILATLGPTSESWAVIEQMLAEGLNAVRINMSHGNHEQHEQAIRHARQAAAAMNLPLSVLVDLSGPKIRTRGLHDGVPVILPTGESFIITTRDVVGDHREVSTNFAPLTKAFSRNTSFSFCASSLWLGLRITGKPTQ